MNATKKYVRRAGLVLVVFLATVLLGQSRSALPVAAAGIIPEGKDFATYVLRDPWDMNALSDVYWGLGQSAVTGISLQNGIFAATASNNGGAYFNILFPGFDTSRNLKAGKDGVLHPIDSSTYRCLYVSMSTSPNPANDYLYATWFADFNMSGAANGHTKAKFILPGWNLYKIDLAAEFAGGTQWANQNWQGLQILPTAKSGVTFSVNWVRLTDCVSVSLPVSWTPPSGGGLVSVLIQPAGTNRQIKVASGISGGSGSTNVDVQGVMPGSYIYLVQDQNSTTISSATFEITPRPVVTFVRPAAETGTDFATSVGQPWNMNDSNAVTQVRCANYSFQGGLLVLDTLPPSQLPANCKGGVGEADPNIFLNTPAPANISQYRYMSFRHLINGTIPAPEAGMIARMFWTANGCIYTGKELALDTLWQTYRIDMFDPSNSMPLAATPSSCPLTSWKNQSASVTAFRFDPNENISGSTLHQEIAWIRLTQVDSVQRGTPFPIRYLLNKSSSQVSTLNFYYTTDLAQPTQHPAIAFNSTPSPSPRGPFSLFLPMVGRNLSDSFVENGILYQWDTTSVNPGQYIVCAEANDGYNPTTYFCSEAQVQVN